MPSPRDNPRLPKLRGDYAKAKPGTYAHPHDSRVKLEVLPSGKRGWFIRVRVNGKQERVSLGDVSEVVAQRKAGEARELATRGISPNAQREIDVQQQRAAHNEQRAALTTFAQVRAEFFASADFTQIRASTAATYNWSLKSAYVKMLEGRAIVAIKRREIEQIRSAIVKAGHVTTSQTVMRSLRRLFNFAKLHEYVSVSPLDGIKVGSSAKRREPFIQTGERADFRELVAVLHAIDDMEKERPHWRVYATLYRVGMYTGLRPNAVETLEWRDLSLGERPTMTIRAENAKLGETYVVPISEACAAVLRDLRARRGEYLTAAARSSDLVFPGKYGTQLAKPTEPGLFIDVRRNAVAHGWKPFRGQRFRDTFVSWAEWRGVSYLEMCALVGWKKPGQLGSYSEQASPREQLRMIVERWAGEVEEARKPQKSAKVRRLKGRSQKGLAF